MKRVASLFLGLLFTCFGAPVHSQQAMTVAALLDQGGSQLTKDELLGLLKNATWSGVQAGTNAKFKNKLGEDGTLKGSAVLANGQNVEVQAKWTVADSGNFQGDFSNSIGNRWKSSLFFFKIGERYFSARSTDKGAQLNDTQIEK